MGVLPLCLALASQAGGGGAFGGGGGGGGDGDGGLPIELLFWLVRLAIEYPAFGVPLLIVVVVVFAIGTRRGWWKHQERVIARARPVREERAHARATDALRRSDPAFEPAAFLARMETAFRKAQDAWCAQELEPIRAFVSDGVFERFSLQIAEQREAGWRQGMHSLVVAPLAVQHVELGRQFETVTVRIRFEADIHRVDLAGGARIAGSELPRREFEECWSFVRRRGARTRNAAGLIEGQCPNCGAPLGVNQSAKCASCAALVRSGEFDWVLAEITQASEWRAEDERAAPGFEAYAQRDPALSVQLLEDRASVAFWRWSDVARTRRVEALVRVATDEFCERETARLAELQRGALRSYVGDRAVGSVRTRGLLSGAPFDRAVVELVWDGRFAKLDADGKPRFDAHRSLRRTLFVFRRAAGAKTEASAAFSSAICANCGAHDAGGVDPRCPYCGAPRQTGAGGWLLADVVEQGSPAHFELVRECDAAGREAPRAPVAAAAHGAAPTAPRPALSRASLLAWAVAGARADGDVHPKERAAIEALAQRLGDSPEHLEALLNAPLEQLATPRPANKDEAVEWLVALCELALADGSVPRSEQDFLRRVATSFAIEQRELAAAYDTARNRLYRESKAALRG
jgi:uncharacterized tellurite resistance protein B-like protein